MRTTRNRILRSSIRGLVIAASFSAVIYVSLYAAVKNSNAYLCVKNYIAISSTINEEFGEVRKTSLSPQDFYFKSDGADGSAKIKVNISGKNKDGKVIFSLKQEAGEWKVQKLSIL